MPDFLYLKPEEIETKEKRGKCRVNIVGCGKRGIEYLVESARAGYKVAGIDTDPSVIKLLSKGKIETHGRDIESRVKNLLRTGMLMLNNDVSSSVAESDVIVLTIEAKFDTKGTANLAELENVTKQIGSELSRGRLVIYGGIATFGLMDGVIKETLENTSGLKAGEDFGLAYVPVLNFRIENTVGSWNDQEFIIAANDTNSSKSAELFLNTLGGKNAKKAVDFKTAELAVLFSIARRDLNTALSNEFAMLCQNTQNDYFETLIVDSGFNKHCCVPTATDENWKNEMYLLLDSADSLNTKLRLTTIGRQINESMAKHAICLVQETLHICGKTMRRARITVVRKKRQNLGENDFVKMLEEKGTKVCNYYSPLSRGDFSDAKLPTERTFIEATEGSDCLIILTPDVQLSSLNLKNLRTVMRPPAAIIDLIRVISPDEVVREGFIYRGLGRGFEKT